VCVYVSVCVSVCLCVYVYVSLSLSLFLTLPLSLCLSLSLSLSLSLCIYVIYLRAGRLFSTCRGVGEREGVESRVEGVRGEVGGYGARPTQSMIYVHLLVNRFEQSIALIVQYKYLKFSPEDLILQNLIPRTRLCGNGFITQPSWLVHFRQINMIGRKCLVPIWYQLRKGLQAGLALTYSYRIHRVG